MTQKSRSAIRNLQAGRKFAALACVALCSSPLSAQHLITWGNAFAGKLGPESGISGTNWQSAFVAGDYSAAIDGDSLLYTWGHNAQNQLGDGTDTPNRETPLPVNQEQWKTASLSGLHGLAIKKDGTLWAWGENGNGQLGNGTMTSSKIPVQAGTDNDWVSVSAGGAHSAGVRSDGSLWTWGSLPQSGGGLGLEQSPRREGAESWTAVSSCDGNLLLIRADGTLWAWGENGNGQLGNGTTSEISTRTQIGTDNDWAWVRAGRSHSLGIKTDGTLWAWGVNRNGQLGDSTTTNRLEPVQVGTDNDWKSAVPGEGFSYALKHDSTLWFWGEISIYRNVYDFPLNARIPARVGTDRDWTSVTTDVAHVAALKRTRPDLSASVRETTRTDIVQVFPNPATTEIHLKSGSAARWNKVQLFDMNGRVVFAADRPVTSISVSGFPRGLYLLQVSAAAGNRTQQVILR